MNRLERIDMCTVVPYEYMSVSDVLNGLIYLTLSSPTRVDAVWRALRPFKDGLNFLLDPLYICRGGGGGMQNLGAHQRTLYVDLSCPVHVYPVYTVSYTVLS